MELSEAVQGGLRLLADRRRFPPPAFSGLLQAAFRSLLGCRPDQAALDHPDFEHIDPAVLKYCYAATATCIVEVGKHRTERAALSTYLEDCKFDRERIEQFCTEYQKNKDSLEILLGSVGRCPLHITDVSWHLEYQIKTNQLHKNYHPAYLISLNTESSDSRSHPDLNFSCSMEQLQVNAFEREKWKRKYVAGEDIALLDLVGKLKDAAKSLERTSQL